MRPGERRDRTGSPRSWSAESEDGCMTEDE